jgi:hypothetical protein
LVYEHHEYQQEDLVIKLHDVARSVEKELGKGKLSKDIRECADKLNVLVKSKRKAK